MLEKRFSTLKHFGVSSFKETSIKDRDIVILDEGAELVPSKEMSKGEKDVLNECQRILSRIARLGRAVNVNLIFTTQYPTGDILNRSIKQNCDGKVAFRVPTQVASQVCIDSPGAEELPHELSGRIIYKTDRFQTCQVPYDKDFYKYVSKYEVTEDDLKHREESETGTTDTIVFG